MVEHAYLATHGNLRYDKYVTVSSVPIFLQNLSTFVYVQGMGGWPKKSHKPST